MFAYPVFLKRLDDYKSHSLLKLIKTPESDLVLGNMHTEGLCVHVACFSLELCVPIMLVAKCSSAGVTVQEGKELLCRGKLALIAGLVMCIPAGEQPLV